MFVLLSVLILSVPLVTSDLVNTKSGPVVGRTEYFDGMPVKTYLGIPFAQPPVGKLRFRKTVPVEPWIEPLLAYKFPPSCFQFYPYQYPWYDDKPGDSEDCLYLNIWVPESDKKELKAVMFWIYGGGYSTGSNRLPVYNGSVLAAEGDVIVVTVNYRVGIFGFLSIDSEEAPGNMGKIIFV